MRHGPAETLWYLAPGLAHQLGNALFTLQGRARLLLAAEAGTHGDDCRAILDGVDRAQTGLELLRWLLDEGRTGLHPAGNVLRALADALRVPLRDRGVVLELPAPSGEPSPLIAPAPLCQLATAAARALAETLLGATAAVLQLRWAATGGELQVAFTLRSGADGPPLARGRLDAADVLRAELTAAGARLLGDGEADLAFALAAAKTTFRVS